MFDLNWDSDRKGGMFILTKTRFRVGLVIFGVFLVGIIVAANRGACGWLWSLSANIPHGDKVGHLVLIGFCSFLLNGSLGGRRAPGRFRGLMLGSLLLLIVVTIEEGSQFFNVHRTCDPVDWLANVMGVALGEVSFRILILSASGVLAGSKCALK